jgi:HEAT repeat protein
MKTSSHRVLSVCFLLCELLLAVVVLEASGNLAESCAEVRITQRRQLVENLKDRDPLVRAKAAYSLGKMGHRALPAVPALVDLLSDSSSLAWTISAEWHPPRPNTTPGLEAARALGSLAARSVIVDHVIPVLIKYYGQGENDYSETAVEIMAEIGPAANRVVPLLLDRVRGPWNRFDILGLAATVTALSKIAPADPIVISEIVGVLRNHEQRIPLGNDPERARADRLTIRTSAIRAIGRIGPRAKDGVPLLIQALRDREETNRLVNGHGDDLWKDAAEALGSIGPAAKRAVPFLIDGLSQDIFMAPETIHPVLWKITGENLGMDVSPGSYWSPNIITERWLRWWQRNKARF